jgi:hypothetical protein
MTSLPSKLQHNYSKIYRIFIVLLAVAAILAVAPNRSKFQYEFSLGLPWVHAPLYAPFTFAINKTEKQVAQEKQAIIGASHLYFTLNRNVEDSVLSNFETQAQLVVTADSTLEAEQLEPFKQNGAFKLQRIYQTGLLAHHDS